MFATVGIIGNFLSGYQSPVYILLDMITYSKFLINIIAFGIWFPARKSKCYEETAWLTAAVISLILVVIIIHENWFPPYFPYLSDRYGVKSLKLFFSNQTYLALSGVTLLIIHYCFGQKRRLNNIFILLDCIISVSTYRTKAIGFIAISLVVIYCLSKFKVRNLLISVGILGTVGVLAGWRYLDYYFFSGNSNSLRLLLFKGGFATADRFSPFGAGFGTYCSAASKLNFSELYSALGMQTAYLWQGLHDLFWASILGQFGYLGTAVYFVFLFCILLIVSTMKSINNRYFWSGILILSYLFIASLGESSFSSFYSVQFGALLGYLYIKCKRTVRQ